MGNGIYHNGKIKNRGENAKECQSIYNETPLNGMFMHERKIDQRVRYGR